MVYQTLDSVNTSAGIQTLFTYSAGIVPFLIPLILFGFFLTAMLSSFFIQKRTKGYGDFPASFAVAGFTTAILSVIFSFIPDLIKTSTLVTTIGVAIVGVLWLVFSRKEN